MRPTTAASGRGYGLRNQQSPSNYLKLTQHEAGEDELAGISYNTVGPSGPTSGSNAMIN